MANEAKIVLSAQDNASVALTSVQARITKLKTESSTTAGDMKKLSGAFQNLGADALGLRGSLGEVSKVLMGFAGSGMLVGAVTAGLGSIISYFRDLRVAQDDAKSASEDLQLALIGAVRGREAEMLARSQQANDALTAAQKKLDDFKRSASTISYNAKTGLAETSLLDPKKLAELEAFRDRAQKAAVDAGVAYSNEVNARVKRQQDDINRAQQTAAREAEQRRNDAQRAADAAKKDAQRAADEAAAMARQQASDQKRSYNERTDALSRLVSIGYTGVDIENGLADAIDAQQKVLAAATPLTKEYADELERLVRLQKAQETLTSAKIGAPVDIPIDPIYDEAQKMRDAWGQSEKNKEISDALTEWSMKAELASDSFELLFDSMGQGGNAAQNLLRGFGRLFAGIARQKVGMNIAEGVENTAKALAAAANPLTAAEAVGFKAAAVANFKAAALWGAVGGAASATSSGGGGGGSVGGSSFRNTTNDDQLGRGNITIVFPEGPVDFSNPNTQRQYTKLFNQIIENRGTSLVGA